MNRTMSGFDLKDYQEAQEDILYSNGKYHSTHRMFVDLDDMWRGCLACRTGDGTVRGFEKLKLPCEEARDEKN